MYIDRSKNLSLEEYEIIQEAEDKLVYKPLSEKLASNKTTDAFKILSTEKAAKSGKE